MLLIDQVDLEARGISCQGVSEFIFLDKCFQKGQTFENSQRERAIASCRQMLDAGLMSLIVNYQSHFTIWVESELDGVAPSSSTSGDSSTAPSPHPTEAETNPSDWNYKQMMTKLNEPINMKTVMAKLNEPISFKSIFSKAEKSQSSE